MDLWFFEQHTKHVKIGIEIEEHIYHEVSDFQQIDIFDSYEFGRFLTLDGCMMLTEKDEFIYHEMIVHVSMCALKNVKNVLIIGGGDGGSAREVLRYDSVEHVDLVEIDESVVKACREFLPQTAGCLSDPRLKIYYEDGLKFVRHKVDEYDLIIVDSTDPFGPGEGLFTKEFYGNCFNALHENGAMVNQHENPVYPADAVAMQRAHARIVSSFPISRVYQAQIPTYPSGYWLFGFASKKIHPVKDADFDAWNRLGIETKYYNTNLHRGSFALPSYVEKILRKVE